MAPAGPVGGPVKEFCKRGHPRIGPDADIYVHPKTGVRHCRKCSALHQREHTARRRAASSMEAS